MEPITQSVVITLNEEIDIAESRRAASGLGRRIGLGPEAVARAEIVVVELAGNILKHAGSGLLYLSSNLSGNSLQVIATDTGPGIASVAQALTDGYTTSTTPGFGLGAVSRLAAGIDIYTQVGKGTVVSAVVGDSVQRGPGEESPSDSTAVLSTSLEGEIMNGDACAVFPALHSGFEKPRQVYLMVDGLGHGLYASEAAAMAVNIAKTSFAAEPTLGLEPLVRRMHGPMHATRGAAMLLVSVLDGVAISCGVGNISGTLHAPDGTERSLVSNNGTVGHTIRRVQEFQFKYTPGTLLSMHSDGITTKWRFGQYPNLAERAPATIAGLIYRDAARGRDDATVLVSRLGEPFA